jgi:hypothetical protein
VSESYEAAETATVGSGPRVPEPRVPEYSPPPPTTTSAWGGWVTFAGITIVLIGVVHVIEALVALLDSDKYLVGSNGLVLQLSYTTWGWIHLVLGVVLILTGVGVLNGNALARIVGVAACGLSALLTLSFLAANPLWAAIVITLDVFFIYAICVHGDEAH